MFNKKFEDITLEDIQELVDNKVIEDIRFDYKEKFSFGASEDKGDCKELVKDISAFANADGGLIIVGVKEKKHQLVGIKINDEDGLRRRIIDTVKNNTDPSFTGIRMRTISVDNEKVIFLIKIEKNSLTVPIRNTVDNKVYLRTDNKISEMDMVMIREYGNGREQKEDISQKIKQYTSDRIYEIIAKGNDKIHTENPLYYSYIIMQFVPENFEDFHCDINTIRKNAWRIERDKIERDEFTTFTVRHSSFSCDAKIDEYLKFYTSGIVEWASNEFIYRYEIDWKRMIREIFELSKKCLAYYDSIGNNSPLHIRITLINVQGCVYIEGFNPRRSMEENIFNSKDILLKEHDEFNIFIYKRFFDDLFNTLGLDGCPMPTL